MAAWLLPWRDRTRAAEHRSRLRLPMFTRAGSDDTPAD
ncbi:conserved hypothetical protein [Xanthomonas oryzae pv. oryzae KACC 10331]|uniref:Uncharacterized protein n=1 Tax=Xanthomonas oryzae pv. oryzae (strain KACC10331 / KXO85) TaxID=291331 RepID=Q5GXK6_XANOR|nr:conserved hypothetical protein [Xanthomonas oryzae pv. oryzae KACC 10331]